MQKLMKLAAEQAMVIDDFKVWAEAIASHWWKIMAWSEGLKKLNHSEDLNKRNQFTLK